MSDTSPATGVALAPGPRGIDMLRSYQTIRNDPLRFLSDLRFRHGDLVQLPIPGPGVFLLSDPAQTRDLLARHSDRLSKRTPQYVGLAELTGNGLLTADDPPWRGRRKLIAACFGGQRNHAVERAASDASAELAGRWRQFRDWSIVDIEQAALLLSLDVLGSALFGARWQDSATEVAAATTRALDCVVRRARLPLPVHRWLPLPSNREFAESKAVLDRAVTDLVRAASSGEVDENSLVSHLVKNLTEQDQGSTAAAVRDELVTFLVAGHETVAAGLTWALANLATSCYWQRQLDGDSGDLAQAIVAETLRMFPPAWVLSRRLREPHLAGNTVLPEGSLVIISPWVIHRHPDHWDAPDTFDPGRFVGTRPTACRAYLPFGLGARTCIGREFGLVELATALRRLTAELEFAPVGTLPEPVPAVALRPSGGLYLRVRRRR